MHMHPAARPKTKLSTNQYMSSTDQSPLSGDSGNMSYDIQQSLPCGDDMKSATAQSATDSGGITQADRALASAFSDDLTESTKEYLRAVSTSTPPPDTAATTQKAKKTCKNPNSLSCKVVTKVSKTFRVG